MPLAQIIDVFEAGGRGFFSLFGGGKLDPDVPRYPGFEEGKRFESAKVDSDAFFSALRDSKSPWHRSAQSEMEAMKYGKSPAGYFTRQEILRNNGKMRLGGVLRGSMKGAAPMRGLRMGASWIKGNLALAPFDVAISAGLAPKGHKLSAGAASLVAQVVGGNLGTVIGGAVGGLFGMPVLGAIVGGAAGDTMIRNPLEEGLQYVVELGTNIRHLNFGGKYEDSQMAFTMRQVAARELSGSLLNARQWLGKEASFLHQ